MQLTDKVVSLQELCTTFQVSEEWMRRNWKKLHTEKGMPEKCQLGWVWPRKSLEQWIDGQYGKVSELASTEQAADMASLGHPSAFIANQNRILRAKYAGARA